jgi:hypothetical protein
MNRVWWQLDCVLTRGVAAFVPIARELESLGKHRRGPDMARAEFARSTAGT